MNKLFISMYHYTRDLTHSRYPKIKGLDYNLFKEQIVFFKENFNIVTMQEVIECSQGKYQLPENALLLTFDDGYIDNYTYALPILEEYKMQGSFFIPGKTFKTHQLLDVNKIHFILASGNINSMVNTLKEKMDFYRGDEFDYLSNDELWFEHAVKTRFDCKEVVFIKRMLQTVLPEKLRNIISSEMFEHYVGISEEKMAYELYMNYDQIKTMKRHGMFIGLHGYDHYWLGNLSDEKMKKDVDMALESLDEFIDTNKWVMNYPYGNYNENVIDYIEKKGAVLGLTTKVDIANIGKDNSFKLPRLDCNDFSPKSDEFKKY